MKEETLSSALLLAFAIAFIIIFLIAAILFVVECIEKYIYTKEERRYRYKAGMKAAVHVLLCGNPVWLNMENLKDDKLAMRDLDGEYETPEGEQHFTWNNAVKAAEKQGKRLLACEEYKFIASLPRRWDDEKKGLWFKFPTRKQFRGLLRFINPIVNYLTAVDVFFPAVGYRGRATGVLSFQGASCLYWSATVTGTNAYYLNFGSGNISPSGNIVRANGYSVRCVKD